MEIIKHSKLKTEQKEYELECSKCGCQFIFNDEEIEKKEKGLNGDAWIHCPECDNEIQFTPLLHFHTNQEISEIIKLHIMLSTAKIPHEFKRIHCGRIIRIYNKDKTKGLCNVVEMDEYDNRGYNGLLEMQGALTKEEEKLYPDGIKGGMLAYWVFDRFKYCYEHDTDVYVKGGRK